jgi:hypothetical protein
MHAQTAKKLIFCFVLFVFLLIFLRYPHERAVHFAFSFTPMLLLFAALHARFAPGDPERVESLGFALFGFVYFFAILTPYRETLPTHLLVSKCSDLYFRHATFAAAPSHRDAFGSVPAQRQNIESMLTLFLTLPIALLGAAITGYFHARRGRSLARSR